MNCGQSEVSDTPLVSPTNASQIARTLPGPLPRQGPATARERGRQDSKEAQQSLFFVFSRCGQGFLYLASKGGVKHGPSLPEGGVKHGLSFPRRWC